MSGRFRFEAFQPGRERWSHYEERLLFAMDMQGVETEWEMKAALVSVCNPEQYEAVAVAVAPLRVTDARVSYEQVTEAKYT